jgi:carbon monoxide dehydrogenase subunit G
MPRFQTSVVIKCSIEAVFAYLSDVEQFKQRTMAFRAERSEIRFDRAGVHKFTQSIPMPPLEQETEGPLCVGTVFRQKNGAPNRPLEATIQIVECEPARCLAFTQMSGHLKGYVRWLLEPIAEGTRLTQTIEMELEGILAVIVGLLARKSAQRNLNQDLLNLKQELEGTN